MRSIFQTWALAALVMFTGKMLLLAHRADGLGAMTKMLAECAVHAFWIMGGVWGVLFLYEAQKLMRDKRKGGAE